VQLRMSQQHLNHPHVDIALQQVCGERVPQRMRRDPAAEPRRLGRHVADAVELAHRHWQEWIPAREQPAFRPTLQPPCSQQLQKLWRQHGMPIPAALAHLDTDQHALGINVADPQHDDFAAAQAGAVGDAERGLVLETGTWRGLDQPGDLIWSKDTRQLPRIVRAGQLMGEVGAAERDGEEEAQRRGLPIHLRRLRALLDLRQLEAADVVAGRSVGRAAEKSGKGLNIPDIIALRLVAEGPDRHVCDHTGAKIADRLVTHRRLLSSDWSLEPSNPQDGRPPRHRLSISWLTPPSPLAPLRAQRFPARAGSFSGASGSQGAATDVSALRSGADWAWRPQECCAPGGAVCPW